VTDLFEQIIDRWQQDTLLVNVAGPYAFAPKTKLSTIYPHATFHQMGSAFRESYSGSRVENIMVQFHTRHTDFEVLRQYHERIQHLFPRKWLGRYGCLLTSETMDVVKSIATGEPVTDSSGQPVYFSTVRWMFTGQAAPNMNVG
jgi:hypothetical protein